MTGRLPDSEEIVLVVGSAIADGDAALLCARLRAFVAGAGSGGAAVVVVCDVHGLRADIGAIDALARLALTARRLGGRISLRGASEDLLRVVAFCGLRAVLPLGGVQAQRQAEEREQALGVEERVDRRDAPV